LQNTTILALDPIGGIAGDMCIAALLHLGDQLGRGAELRAALGAGLRALAESAGAGAIDLGAVQVRESIVEVNGIRALHVDVELPEAIAAQEPHHRAFRDIRELLARAALPENAKQRALATFSALAVAEGKIHGVPPDDVEFHEVGALDAIVDVVGTCLLVDALGATRLLCQPLPAGSGTIRSAHGTIPIPAPATLELLRRRTLRSSGPGERTTPTGAALAVTLTEETPLFPDLTVLATGYGAGTKRWDDAPNLLRAVLGEDVRGTLLGAGGRDSGLLWQLETNLDDLSPQLIANAVDALISAGAKDAWVAPIVMKKGRPAHLLCALVSEEKRAACEQLIFRETSALGVRAFRVERHALEREFTEVETRYGPIRIKLGLQGGEVLQAAPEFDDCAAAARAHGVAVKEVQAEANAAWRRK
jgi:uncharacterized protein (TIGR00299 family) protein